MAAIDRLAALENGEVPPTQAMLSRMARKYRRPLVTLSDDFAPFVVVNPKDSAAARCFTLLHEVAHLWVGEPGISGGDLGLVELAGRLTATKAGRVMGVNPRRSETRETPQGHG